MIGLKQMLVKLTCPYDIYDLYLTTNTTNPNTLWPWTQWEQIIDDAYLKIVIEDAGVCNGTSTEHKIPISSMPTHTHAQYVTANSGPYPRKDFKADGAFSSGYYQGDMGPAGGGQAYYPYYYGIFVWRRIK